MKPMILTLRTIQNPCWCRFIRLKAIGSHARPMRILIFVGNVWRTLQFKGDLVNNTHLTMFLSWMIHFCLVRSSISGRRRMNMMRQGCNCWRRVRSHNRPIGSQMTTSSRVLLVMRRTTSYPLFVMMIYLYLWSMILAFSSIFVMNSILHVDVLWMNFTYNVICYTSCGWFAILRVCELWPYICGSYLWWYECASFVWGKLCRNFLYLENWCLKFSKDRKLVFQKDKKDMHAWLAA